MMMLETRGLIAGSYGYPSIFVLFFLSPSSDVVLNKIDLRSMRDFRMMVSIF